MSRVLVLGHTGKLGRALVQALGAGHEVIGRSASTGFDLADFQRVRGLLRDLRPGIVVNAAALNGLGPCEENPSLAFHLNSLLPRVLAECSGPLDFQLLHFSTDAVFDGLRGTGAYVESDAAAPINVYGLTKFGGDCFVQAEADRYLLIRLSMLAGATAGPGQFVERMIQRARVGEDLRIAEDIICSPSFVLDVATEVARMVDQGTPGGLYHLANAGQASLHELMVEIVQDLGLKVAVQAVPHSTFPTTTRKNPCTPLRSEKIQPLRSWRVAIRAYCATL